MPCQSPWPMRHWPGCHRRVVSMVICSAVCYMPCSGSVPVTCETPRKCRKNKRAFAPITRYRDTTGARMLADLEEAWARQGIQLRLADAHADVRDILRAEGLEERVSRIDRRMSVDDIVTAFRPVS